MARLSIPAIGTATAGAAAVALLAACGGSGAGSDPAAAGGDGASTGKRELIGKRRAGDSRAGTRRRGKRLRAVGSQFGRVVADGRGEALYLFGRDRGGRSSCYGACARAWPPALTRGGPRALRGIAPRLLGVTRRRNGAFQVTYRGHPLYYYVEDRPGLILCQAVNEFGGLWLVVKPSGSPVT